MSFYPIEKGRAILVLGMHRSGTSALTRVLNLLGVTLSQTLLSGNEANKKGFWEDPRIFHIHDQMLSSLGRSWDDLRALPDGWMESEGAASARVELLDLLTKEFAGHKLWMIKDPRICRLLPLWQRIFDDLGVAMNCILALRHPNEVALSLEARNQKPLAHGRLSWLEHMAEAVLGTRQVPRTVVMYDQLMGDWQQAIERMGRELLLDWPVEPSSIRSEVRSFLSDEERHHRVTSLHSDKCSNLIDHLYAGLASASSGGGWGIADGAARSYLESRQAFLEALDATEGAFVSRQKEWEKEASSAQVNFDIKLRERRLELDDELAETVSQKVAQKLLGELDQRLGSQADTLSKMIQNTEQRVSELEESLQRDRVDRRELSALTEELAIMRASRSWRITAPLRFVARLARRRQTGFSGRLAYLMGLTRVSLKQHGLVVTLRKVLLAPWKHGMRLFGNFSADMNGGGSVGAVNIADLPSAPPALERLEMRVLLVAELGLPQCRLYRVLHKQQMLDRLGIGCTVVDWHEADRCKSLLYTHAVAIFYRVPGFPDQLTLIREAKALGVATYWEVDDLIFDKAKYVNNSNLASLDDETRKGIMFGIPLYRAAMLECGAGIGSTDGVADAMREAGISRVAVIENGLDGEALRVASRVRKLPRRNDGLTRVVYGSGSRAHDADFRVAAPAIRRILLKNSSVRLRVVGDLRLPEDYDAVEGQVERLPSADYATYMRLLAECDITLAPLENTAFNEAKSNIKFLEGAIVGLPAVCSPRAAFRSVIDSGINGFLADDDLAWERALEILVADPGMRAAVASRARDYVMAHYPLDKIAEEQLAPLVRSSDKNRGKLRVLGVNVFFSPRSFGGATIVAEETMKLLNQREDIDYAMFTSLPSGEIHPYQLVRYGSHGGNVFGMALPLEAAPAYSYSNPHSPDAFLEAVRAFRPHVVHLHSIQGIGARLVEVCRKEKIPYVVTLHDAWWICERQFMVNYAGHYCHQRKIDLDVCARCVPDANANRSRQVSLHEILLSASLLLSPSEFFRQLYIENGFDPERVVVNKNGIREPARSLRREPVAQRRLRLGFVGGDGPIKGGAIIRRALRSLPNKNYVLKVVDNELNLGRRSIDPDKWAIPGTLEVVPAYTQSSIDEFFSGIDILLFPTQWKESFGLSVREALIRDVWVIATDAGGVVEDIVDGENGDVISLEDDGTELAVAIARLLNDPSRLDGYRNPYASQIRFFDRQADELFDLFSQVSNEAHNAVVQETAAN